MVAALVALSGSSAGLGKPASPDCFGLPATILGTAGDDRLVGTEGNDVIDSLGGDDQIIGFGGDDRLCGGAGNDGFVPGLGDDRVDGGGGGRGLGFIDLVLFEFATSGVQADLRTGTATGEGADILLDISVLGGTRFADTLDGNVEINIFFPGDGDDVVNGGGGTDSVGFDRGVTANLAVQSSTGEGTDVFSAVEDLLGSEANDVLLGDGRGNMILGGGGDDQVDGRGGDDSLSGDSGNDRVLGGQGNDRIRGDDGNDRLLGASGDDTLTGGGGNDSLDGGRGADAISYVRSMRAIQANLLVGRVAGEGVDDLAAVENVDASPLRDQMLGDDRVNFLYGNAGADRITGGPEADFLDGGAASSSLEGGAGEDYCLNGAGARRCEIFGVPGRVPVVPDEPPMSKALSAALVPDGRARAGLVMPVPTGHRGNSVAVQALQALALRVLTRGDVAEPSAKEFSFSSPLQLLFESAVPRGTGSYRYAGQPTCRPSKPFRTTVAPPEQVQPAVSDGAREQVFWRGILFKQDSKTGRLTRLRHTPWVTGLVQGENVPTGFPAWYNTDLTAAAPRTFSYTVPSGTYAWVGSLKWFPSGGRVRDFIEPPRRARSDRPARQGLYFRLDGLGTGLSVVPSWDELSPLFLGHALPSDVAEPSLHGLDIAPQHVVPERDDATLCCSSERRSRRG